MKPYFEKLTSYELLMQHGDAETKRKVEAFVDKYSQNLINGALDGEKWTIDFLEPDEESAVKFKKTILINTTQTTTKQLEIVSNFSLDDPRFATHLGGNKVRLLFYCEQEGKSMLTDADVHVLDITSGRDGNHSLVSKRGRMYGKWDAVKESVVSTTNEIEKD